jgi:hypothetical protein|uniref:Uncharacterized protein n=1 Tax=viral metagenome TaxID=1070528 RepID=A0A6C0ILX7_9ZZZZ
MESKLNSTAKKKGLHKKKPTNKTLKTKLFKDSLAKLSSGEILTKALDLDEIIEIEEKNASQIKPKLIKDLSSLEKALNRTKNGGYIVVGDAHHGDLIFDLIVKLYPNLSEDLQKLLKTAYYFSENGYQTKELQEKGIGKKFVGLDDGKSLHKSKYDELRRNHQANTDWSEIIMKNRHSGVHIISIGRSHLYTIKGKNNGSKIEKVLSFQDTLKKRSKKPITVFAMNNDIDLNYDNYKEYAKTHQLDEVTNNPKIRSLFVV